MDNKEKLKALLEESSPEVLALVKLKWAVEEICEEYDMDVYAHSACKDWYSLATNPTKPGHFNVEVFIDTDNLIRVRATAMPLRESMAKLDLGEFSYPNPAWDTQMQRFKKMVLALEDIMILS
ncbi:hypothetical protein [Providencia phage PSTCR5]|uniref:Uncharacterized protein n=1 Tax=Providencia phage PSTCR5 TaxID=2783547 RepID=A0A873WHS6_9CAUD|nr:hypothetical protein KNV68_gp092 [Providencia phage PSTCR5]QPB12190.1 hypothetical protein [Providencia phage PSTCR5]